MSQSPVPPPPPATGGDGDPAPCAGGLVPPGAAGQGVRALEEREAHLRFAAIAGRIGLWELDLETFALTSSEVCREHFGLPAEQPLSWRKVLVSIHPDDAARVRAAFEHSIAQRQEYAIDHRIRRRDGLVRWLKVLAQVQGGTDGRRLRIAGTAQDVTEQTLAERRTQALLQLDDSFRALEDPADMAYAAARMLGEILCVGRAGYGDIDETNTVTIVRDWTSLGMSTAVGRHHLPHYGRFYEDLLRGHIVIVNDVSTDERTASHVHALRSVQAGALVNLPLIEGGRLVAMLFLNHPVPRQWSSDDLALIRSVAHRTRMAVQRRTAERQLRALADTLETKVEERTRELMAAEEALRQAQKMEAVGQLTGGIAHDFNNLLAGIMASLDLLRLRVSQGRVADMERCIDTAHRSAKRAASLTHRLLAFSRRQTLAPVVVDLNQLVADLLELVQRTVGPAITVRFDATAGLWAVRADAGQIENSLLNLCINARDAMPRGGTLRIATANHVAGHPGDGQSRRHATELQPGEYVALSVADTGEGMAPEVAERAFEPFFTTKPLGQGTGLGLSMVYGFAQQSGGSARIASVAGQGTTITLWLPRHACSAAELAAGTCAEAPPAGQARAPASGAGRAMPSVLVVDDEPAVRSTVAESLREQGYRVLEAEDGPSALEMLREAGPLDLLLTDVGLPGGMNGRQVADAGRVLRPGLPVLFITGYAEQAVIGERDLDPGMGVLTKPFALDMLAARVASALAAVPRDPA
ncbi:response regulator [Paracidovorax citrulli]|uniref:histidine kinase n=1 Tax=Paracidovorax citrulli TaxID=80869 RepID=A0ABY9AQQ8_PARCI|nr:response regulator [Paracidovorax citrulli]PVY64720.1 PAS domain S-box-containing protein [Paracidovorax citrulli]QCX10622.1 Blue-light-activated protein [Paracidovorax citrulli]REG71083.1 PAS domain S-box-containing protein [Paracidovorax citrulli]RLJ95636.1 PAS domain S-box-containing protein [Paracidovorax citrulli]UEG46401.1 response regulator [Paracidovorax citrulli]